MLYESRLGHQKLFLLKFNSFRLGVVLAVYGVLTSAGTFEVLDVMFPSASPSSPLPVAQESDEPCYVLLICGLRFDSKEGKNGEVQILRHHLLNWLLGNYGGREEQEKVARIVRVIIAGNSIMAKKPGGRNCFSQMAKYLSRKMIHPSVEAASSLDSFLKQLANYVPVDLMPGETDPTNHLLPQQALHSCMFPEACRLPNFNRVTNPYCASVCGITFLGTSGQTIDDLCKNSVTDDRISVMLNTLKWGHLCPTMPDTLGCYPYESDDPFIIRQLPHVYFAANQPAFSSSFCALPGAAESNTHVRLLSLPSFCESGYAALVNLQNLAVEPIIFKTSASI
ncbi:DNA pol E B domain containing protein [Trichuris trichiura]|uniref:DNA pol E B domain containing protein n=1 Tax=Trichuris trichiura TaxID=36087 RepID=A0A077ZM45_TRITR|nr:DNA pol E B domain containing protein [Trichuris trichiura]